VYQWLIVMMKTTSSTNSKDDVNLSMISQVFVTNSTTGTLQAECVKPTTTVIKQVILLMNCTTSAYPTVMHGRFPGMIWILTLSILTDLINGLHK